MILENAEHLGIIALSIGVILYLPDQTGLLHTTSIITLFLAAIAMRMYAYYRVWHLPVV